MPTSGPPSSSDAGRARSVRPYRIRDDERGVTEVLGQILVFGILSIVLVLSMIAFNAAKTSATDRAARLQGEAAAQQVASIVVEASLYVERHDGEATFHRELELPESLEGRAYTVHLEPAGSVTVCQPTGGPASNPDWIRLHIDGLRDETGSGGCLDDPTTAVLFAAGAPATVDLLETEVPGGPVKIRFDANGDCSSILGTPTCLFLEGEP